jgi:hypothetical protein
MERIVIFSPAFDKRHPEPGKNYGIHGVELKMVLKGDKGATQFVLYTNWMLPHVTKEMDNRILRESTTGRLSDISLRCTYHPLPADLGYHSPVPQYEGQSICSQSCEYLDGKPCYYDGSGLNAERIYEVLLKEGSEGVWKELENYYNDLFGKENLL